MREGQRQAIGHTQLLHHQVHACGLLGHRVLHLQAGIDLQEGDGATLAEQEFHRARAGVAGGSADVTRRGVDALALCVGQKRCRGFFDQLLVAPLQRAVARAQYHHVAVAVGQHLRFDVARLVQELLDKAFAPAKGGDGFAHGGVKQLSYFVHAPGDLHAAPATAKSRLDDDGQAVLLGKGQNLAGVLHRVGRAHHQRCADLERNLACLHLVAELGNGGRRRANPGQAGVNHGLGKALVLGQKSVAGMDRVGAALLGDLQQLGDVQVGIGRPVTIQAISLVSHARVQRVNVGIGIHRHRLHAVVGTGAHDAHGDLATVGDQNFFHHGASFRCLRLAGRERVLQKHESG